MKSDDIMIKIIKIIKKLPVKFYNVDYFRITLNLELNDGRFNLSNHKVGRFLSVMRNKKLLIREGTKGRYLYKWRK